MCIDNCVVDDLMVTKHNSWKTIGTKMSPLLNTLYDRAQTTFPLADAVEITGLRRALASGLLHNAGKRGLVSRLKRGVWVVVPPELGSATEYAANPYLVAQRLAGNAPHFISHAS